MTFSHKKVVVTIYDVLTFGSTVLLKLILSIDTISFKINYILFVEQTNNGENHENIELGFAVQR